MGEISNGHDTAAPGGNEKREGGDIKKMPLRVLIIEDSEEDTELLVSLLIEGSYDPSYVRVETPEQFMSAINEQRWDIVLSDYSMPAWTGIEALELFKKEGPDIPFIIVSGIIGEDTAVEAMRAGAYDYVMKDRPNRLLPAIERELREAGVRAELRWGEERLRESEENYRQFVENFRGIAFQLGRDPTSVFIHGATEEITGYAQEELLSGNPTWDQITHPDDRVPTLAGPVSEDASADRPEREYRIIKKGGDIAWVHMVKWNIYDASGQVSGVQGAIYDITERKRMEEELRRLNEELEQKVGETERHDGTKGERGSVN